MAGPTDRSEFFLRSGFWIQIFVQLILKSTMLDAEKPSPGRSFADALGAFTTTERTFFILVGLFVLYLLQDLDAWREEVVLAYPYQRESLWRLFIRGG